MPCIDACVFPYPSGSHSVARIISDLRILGYSGAVLCTPPGRIDPPAGFSVFPARYIRSPAIREIQKEVQAGTKEGSICMVRAGEGGVTRSILTTPGVRILCDLQTAPRNSFDRVCAQTAADRGIAVDIRIAPLIQLRGVARQRVIRQYEEILLLQKRYGFPLTISSGAVSPEGLRSPRAVQALLSLLGMDRELIAGAFASIGDPASEKGPVRRIS